MDVAENVAMSCAFIREAAAKGAGYIQTPEMTTLMRRGRDASKPQLYGAEQTQALARFQALAKELGVVLHIGSMPVSIEGDKLANRGFVIDKSGEITGQYDKIHLFDVAVSDAETWQESATYAPGNRAVVARAGDLRIGMSICYDLRFAALYRALAKAGAQILAVPAAFTVPTGEAHWQTLLKARAIETGCFVLAAAQTGSHQDGRKTYGRSQIINPWGAIIAESNEAMGVLLATIDLQEIEATRARLPAINHDRPFGINDQK